MDLTQFFTPLVTLLGFAIAGIGVVVAVRRDVAILGAKIIPLEAAANRIVDKLEVILDRQGRHDERIKSIERDRERLYPQQHRR